MKQKYIRMTPDFFKDALRYQYERGHKQGVDYAKKRLIAYALAAYGMFDGPEFDKFMEDPCFRGLFHKYWNFVSMKDAGYRRIN
jgi:hypothetical protein